MASYSTSYQGYRPRPSQQGVQNQYGGGFTNTSDPRAQMEQNRMKFAGEGDAINTETTDAVSNYGDLEAGYRDQADSAYNDLQNQPGYTPGQEAQINKDYSQYQTDPNALQQRQLTGDEQTAITGNPNAGFDARDPNGILDSTNQGNDYRLDAAGKYGSAMAGSFDPSQLAESSTYGDTASKVVGGETKNLNDVNSAAGLSLDPKFADRYRMTPQQQQDIVTAAGTTVGNEAQTRKDDIARRAAADGNTSPAAIAAMESRVQNQAEATAGDAMTSARIAASNAAAGREQTLQGMELGSAQDIATRKAQAGTTEANQFLTAADQNEKMRMAGQQDIANRSMEAANLGGQAQMSAWDKTANSDVAAAQHNEGTAISQSDLADQQGSQRASELAQNRQYTTGDIQDTQYKQGVDTATRTSQGAQTVGNADISGMNSYRGYLTGQQGAAQSGATTATQQQIQNSGTQGQLINAATGQKGNQDLGQAQVNQGWVNTGANLVSKLKDGGIVDKPGLYEIGEDGPEAVIPLNSNGRYRDLPRFERGGIIRKPTVGVIGENGPEQVVPVDDPSQQSTPDDSYSSQQPSDPPDNTVPTPSPDPNAAFEDRPHPDQQPMTPSRLYNNRGNAPLQTDAPAPTAAGAPQPPADDPNAYSMFGPTQFSRPNDPNAPTPPSSQGQAQGAVGLTPQQGQGANAIAAQAQQQSPTAPSSASQSQQYSTAQSGQPSKDSGQSPSTSLPVSGSINFGGQSGQQGQMSNIQRAEDGDVFNKPTTALIGENGPEAVVPLDDENSYSTFGEQPNQSAPGGGMPRTPIVPPTATGVPTAGGTFVSPSADRQEANSAEIAGGGKRNGPSFLQKAGEDIQRYRSFMNNNPVSQFQQNNRPNLAPTSAPALSAAVSGIQSGYRNALGHPKPTASGLPGLGSTPSADMGGGGASIPQFGGGQIVDKPTVAMLGEKGPEAVVPLTPRSGQKLTPGQLPQKISIVPSSVKTRYRTPQGPAGIHGPLRSNIPLVPNRPQR